MPPYPISTKWLEIKRVKRLNQELQDFVILLSIPRNIISHRWPAKIGLYDKTRFLR